MKKLNIILHETTIINFPFFWKLMVRYKWLSLFLPLMVFGYSTYYYQSQNDVYLRKKYFKNIATESDSPTSAIASVLGEQTSTLTESEVVGLINSLDFQQEFVDELMKLPEFHKLNLTPINSKTILNYEAVSNLCGGLDQCIHAKLRGLVFSFINIIPDRLVLNKYFVQVNTLDSYTTKFLLNSIGRKIVKSRVSAIKRKIEEQIKISQEIALKKREELEEVDVKTLKEEFKSLTSTVESLHNKIERNNRFRQQLKMELALAETQVSETKKVYKENIESDQLFDSQKRKNLEERIKKYQDDITAIKSVSNSISMQDSLILSQLGDELEKAKRELSRMGMAGRKVSSDAKFISRKEDESNFTEFDFKVKKEQYKKTTVEYESLIAERERVVKELNVAEDRLEAIKPSFEYLKLLEHKIIQLTLLNSTVVSDLVFENQLSPQNIFKKVSKSKIILFSLSISLGLLVLIISTFFLLDDRIYDQHELEKSFEDLTIIGNTPDFD
ncbi:MAG: hypothetical protein K9K67_16145 [Bacteriovoracaceae bacterium]|nr:hypothetical protein [Bacteriovoracaceae bacterium]